MPFEEHALRGKLNLRFRECPIGASFWYHGNLPRHIEVFTEKKSAIAVAIFFNISLSCIHARTDYVSIKLRVFLTIATGAVVIP